MSWIFLTTVILFTYNYLMIVVVVDLDLLIVMSAFDVQFAFRSNLD